MALYYLPHMRLCAASAVGPAGPVSNCSSMAAAGGGGLRGDIAIAAVRALLCGSFFFFFFFFLVVIVTWHAPKLAPALVILFIAKSTWRFWLPSLPLLVRSNAAAAVRSCLLLFFLLVAIWAFGPELTSALVIFIVAKSTWRFWLLPLALLVCSNAAPLPSTESSSSSARAATTMAIGDDAILALCIIALCIGSVITWQQLGSSQLATAPQPTNEQVMILLNWYSHWRLSVDQQISRTEAGLAAARALQARAANAAEAESAVMAQRRIGEIAAMAQKMLALQSTLPPRITIPVGALSNCDLDESLPANLERLAWMRTEAQNIPPTFVSAIARRVRIGYDAATAAASRAPPPAGHSSSTSNSGDCTHSPRYVSLVSI